MGKDDYKQYHGTSVIVLVDGAQRYADAKKPAAQACDIGVSPAISGLVTGESNTLLTLEGVVHSNVDQLGDFNFLRVSINKAHIIAIFKKNIGSRL